MNLDNYYKKAFLLFLKGVLPGISVVAQARSGEQNKKEGQRRLQIQSSQAARNQRNML